MAARLMAITAFLVHRALSIHALKGYRLENVRKTPLRPVSLGAGVP